MGSLERRTWPRFVQVVGVLMPAWTVAGAGQSVKGWARRSARPLGSKLAFEL